MLRGFTLAEIQPQNLRVHLVTEAEQVAEPVPLFQRR